MVPELVQLDQQGFPVMLDMPVLPWLDREARQAVEMCPALALRLTPAQPSVPARAPLPPQPAALPRFVPSPSFGGVPPARALPSQALPYPDLARQALPSQAGPRIAARGPAAPSSPALSRPALNRPALPAAPVSSVALSQTELDDDDDVLTGTIVDLDVSEEWIAEISAGRRQTRC